MHWYRQVAVLIHAFQLWHKARISGKFRTSTALPQVAKSRYVLDRNLCVPQICTNVLELNMSFWLEPKPRLISRDSDDTAKCWNYPLIDDSWALDWIPELIQCLLHWQFTRQTGFPGPVCSHVVYDKNFSHLSLFTGSWSAVSQIHGVAARIKIDHSNSSVERSTRIVQQLEQVF